MEYQLRIDQRERDYAVKNDQSASAIMQRDSLLRKDVYQLNAVDRERLEGKLQCDSTECWAGACQ